MKLYYRRFATPTRPTLCKKRSAKFYPSFPAEPLTMVPHRILKNCLCYVAMNGLFAKICLIVIK